MSEQDLAVKFRDVTQVQKEEAGLLEDLSDIIETMKSLSRGRGTNIESLKQAHYKEIEQLKGAHLKEIQQMKFRLTTQMAKSAADNKKSEENIWKIAQAYSDRAQRLEQNGADNMAKMRAKYEDMITDRDQRNHANDAEIERLTELLSTSEEESAHVRVELSGKFRELKHTRMSMDHAYRQLSTKDQEVTRLQADLAGKVAALNAAQKSTRKLQHHLSHQRRLSAASKQRSEDNIYQCVTQEAIAKILNDEIRTHTVAKHVREAMTKKEQVSLRDLIDTAAQDNELTRRDLDRIYQTLVNCDASSRAVEIEVLRKMDDLQDWLELAMVAWICKGNEAEEKAERSRRVEEENRKGRIGALVALAEICGMKDRLDMNPTVREEDDD